MKISIENRWKTDVVDKENEYKKEKKIYLSLKKKKNKNDEMRR